MSSLVLRISRACAIRQGQARAGEYEGLFSLNVFINVDEPTALDPSPETREIQLYRLTHKVIRSANISMGQIEVSSDALEFSATDRTSSSYIGGRMGQLLVRQIGNLLFPALSEQAEYEPRHWYHVSLMNVRVQLRDGIWILHDPDQEIEREMKHLEILRETRNRN